MADDRAGFRHDAPDGAADAGVAGLRMRPLGDSAVLIELAERIGAEAHERVRAALAALHAGVGAQLLEVVPAWTSVAVYYDPLAFTPGADSAQEPGAASTYAQVCALIERLLHTNAQAAARGAHEPRIVEIPVRYGGADGPDLKHVARHTGLDASEVVRLHAAGEYAVHMIGFSPGFPYLAGMPAQLATPRLDTPRTRVPAGSVGIAGLQTGIYPQDTPGGWRLIGRTSLPLFLPDRKPPTALRVGDEVRFRIVS